MSNEPEQSILIQTRNITGENSNRISIFVEPDLNNEEIINYLLHTVDLLEYQDPKPIPNKPILSRVK